MSGRISREQAFMACAQVWSQRSTCMRRAVGAVVVVDRRIVSHGYNGAPPGEPHCDGTSCVPPGQVGCERARHAEANALDYIPDSLRSADKIMFTTESPCVACASIIAVSRFKDLYYLNEYRVSGGITHLIRQGLRVFRMTPAGIIIRKVIVEAELHEELT